MPAVANAIYDAVGVRVDQVPIHPHMVLKALRRQGQGRRAALRPEGLPRGRLRRDAARAHARAGRRRPGDQRLQGEAPLAACARAAGTMMSREEALRQKKLAALTTELEGSALDAAPCRRSASCSPKTLAEAAAILAGEGADEGDRPPGRRRHRPLAEHEAPPPEGADRGQPDGHPRPRGASDVELRGRRCASAPPRSCSTTSTRHPRSASATPPSPRPSPRSPRRRCATWGRSAATSASTPAAPTTTRPRTGAARSTTA